MDNILIIDASSNKDIKVKLISDEKKLIKYRKLNEQKAQVVLPMIEKCLHEHNLTIKDITQIHVNPGPGSFTGIRVALSVANTLAFLLKIPINKMPLGQLQEPIYT